MSDKVEFVKNGKFYTYDEKPIQAKDYIATSDLLKAQRKIAVILQGPILHENNFTLETVKIYQKTFPNCAIIISTWDNEPKEILQKILDTGTIVVTNSLDAVDFKINTNWQIFSTRSGLDKAKEMGFEWAIKSRCDQRMYETNVPDYLFNLQKLFPVEQKDVIAKSRIITVSLNTFKYRLYDVSDMFQFGHIEDLIRYWSCSYLTKEEHEKEALEYSYKSCKEYYKTNPGQLKFAVDYLTSIGWDVKYTLEDSWRSRAEYFCIIDADSIGLYWPKYTNKQSRWRNFFGDRQFMEAFTFKEWLNIYLNLDNKLYIPEWFVENTSDESETYNKAKCKTLLCRMACLGRFTLERLDLRNYKYENHQKIRVDYCLEINRNNSWKANLEDFRKFLPADKAFIYDVVQQQDKDIFSYDNVDFVIMDSFAELVDKKLVNKTTKQRFWCYYSDIDTDTEEFQEQYENEDLLSLELLDEYYDEFFAKIISTYGEIPIIFLHFPTTYDDRELYKNRAIAIKNSIAKLTQKYKRLISLECDVIEQNPDNSIYHFSARTYDMLAQKIAAMKILPLKVFKVKTKCPLFKKIAAKVMPFSKKRREMRRKLQEKYEF